MREHLTRAARYCIYFMCYSVIGWLYEVFLEVVVYRWGYSDRGVLAGPYCVIYGVGALVLIFALRGLMGRHIRVGPVPVTPALVFAAIVALTTAIELAGSYLMERVTGGWMWDYTAYACNFQGRIALSPSLRFGAGGMLFLYVLQPLFERVTARWPDRVTRLTGGALALLLAADALYTFAPR